MKIANYEVYRSRDTYLILKDLGPWDHYPTITNSVEEVVKAVALHLGGRELYYVDSEGQVDEILHDGSGKFIGFKPGGPQ